MSHLVPSSSVFGGFFWNDCGFGGFAGRPEDEVLADSAGAAGTGAVPRSVGFLCVCCDASTFFRPEVTPSPLLSAAKTLDMSPADAALGVAEGEGAAGAGGGPGGGGGGAGAEVEEDGADRFERYSERSAPWAFQTTPVVWCWTTYLRKSSSREVKERAHSMCFGFLCANQNILRRVCDGAHVSLNSLTTRFA
jgi:hypothetical protein